MAVYACFVGAMGGLFISYLMGGPDMASVTFAVGVTWTTAMHWIQEKLK